MKPNHLSMTHRLAIKYSKNYCNRTPIVKVIVENVVTCFFGTQCRTKHEVDRITRCRDMAIRVCWGHMEPPFLGERGLAMAPLERAMVVSYRLSIVTVALSVTIRPQFAIVNRGWVTLGPNLGVFPLEQTRPVGVAKSERPRLTKDEIIFEEFQPM